MSDIKNAKPDLRSYLNIHQYLEDLYKFRKANEEGFSYELWAQELDFKNRSYLRQIVIGRRSITDATAQLLCDRLNFQGSDREYFHLLVLYSKSRTPEQRNLYGRKLIQLLKSDYQQEEIHNYYELVSTPLYPKLLTLLSFKDINKNPSHLAALLNSNEEDIQKCLQTLRGLQLVEEVNGAWSSKQNAFKVPDQIGDVALQVYHSQSLQEAIQAQKLPKDQRRYKSLLLPLSPTEFAEFLEDLQLFVKQTLKKFDVDHLQQRRLHQVNVNIYPVTEEPITMRENLRPQADRADF